MHRWGSEPTRRARQVVGLALLLGVLASGALADGDAAYQALRAARRAKDADRAAACVPLVVEAFNASADKFLRQSILFELSAVAATDSLDEARTRAVLAFAELNDPVGAWEELEFLLPGLGTWEPKPWELAVPEAIGRLAPDAAVEDLLELARAADAPALAAAGVRALGGYGESGLRLEIARRLVAVAKTAARDRERWAFLGPAVHDTFHRLEVPVGRLPPPPSPGQHPSPGAEWRPDPPPESPPLVRLKEVLQNPNGDEALAAVDACYDAGVSGKALREALESLLHRADEWRVCSMALRAIARCDTEEPPPASVLRHGRSRRWQMRLALAEGLVAYRHVEAVDTLIELLGDKCVRARIAAARSLEALTGEGYGVSQARWSRWRQEAGRTIPFLPRSARPAEPVITGDYGLPENVFFGSRIHGERVVLVLDKSDSMYYGLFDQVVEEVGAFVQTALPTTRFGVIEFDAEPRAWKRSLVPAHASNEADVRAFLTRAKPYGPTNVIDSLRTALDFADADAVVLLSDGMPNRGVPSAPEGILSELRKTNRYRRVAVHTLLMMRGRRFPFDGPRGDDKPELTEAERRHRAQVRASAHRAYLGAFMKQMADENEGTFDVVFADYYAPNPLHRTRPSTDQ